MQVAYKELEQAVALIRTMPQRQQTSRRSSRIQTRSIESRSAEPRSVSSYQNADSSYYVENANDGSGYPVGTYINASNKGAPYNLPTTPWNTLKASAAKEIALITAKQTGDGYQWVIKFNKGHAPHENMIYWFALPADQVPVGRTDFVTVNADGTNVQWSNGAGAGANKPLPQMWPNGVNDSRSWDFKIRNRSGQVIYDWPTVHINSLKDLARAGIISVKLVHQLLLKLLVDKYSNILMEKDQLNHQVCLEFILSSVKVMQVIQFHLKRKVQQLISCIMLQGSCIRIQSIIYV